MFGGKPNDNIIVDKFKINVFNINMDNVIYKLQYRFKDKNKPTADFSFLDPKYFYTNYIFV
jgi:hypothetical protein